jgi:predicted transcriptional regulator with HTH domain
MQINMNVMKRGKSEGEKEKIQVLRSLRRSRVRTEVAMHLYKIYPAASYPADIARNTGIAPTSIIGALRGMGNGFAGTKSLLGLGLAAKIERDGAAYYQLTEQGKSVMDEVAIYDNT